MSQGINKYVTDQRTEARARSEPEAQEEPGRSGEDELARLREDVDSTGSSEAPEAEHRGRLEKRTGKEKGKQSVKEPDRVERVSQESEERRKKEEDEVFEERVKQKFMEAGYSEAHIDTILREKRENIDEVRHDISLDPARPTWVKVNRKYLHPDTLEAYNLPWEFYEASTRQFGPLSS